MKMRVGLVALLSLALLGAYVHAQFGQEAAKLDLVKVKDDLFVIHNDFVPGNTTALITNEGVVLVDDKFEIDHANIMAQLKKVTSQPVKYVINTHFHGDHSGGNAKLQALNAQVVASEAARRKMVETKMPGLPNVTLENRLRLYVGGKRIEVHYLGRAHTDGDVVVLFPDHRVLAMGDMFTFGDATPQLVDYAGGGSAVEWTKTVEGALTLDFDSVVPGHGAVTTKQELQKFRDSTMSLRTKVRDMVAQKRNRAEIEKMLRSDFHFADLHVKVSLDGLIKELQ
jgi:glyoxylase-like metal-dependent hydrolase (beta-lactamase superfamily II)